VKKRGGVSSNIRTSPTLKKNRKVKSYAGDAVHRPREGGQQCGSRLWGRLEADTKANREFARAKGSKNYILNKPRTEKAQFRKDTVKEVRQSNNSRAKPKILYDWARKNSRSIGGQQRKSPRLPYHPEKRPEAGMKRKKFCGGGTLKISGRSQGVKRWTYRGIDLSKKDLSLNDRICEGRPEARDLGGGLWLVGGIGPAEV